MRTEKTKIMKINQRTKKRNNKKKDCLFCVYVHANKTNVLPMANNIKSVMKETILSKSPNSQMHADKESADTRKEK